MSYAMHKQVHPPTGVDHACAAYFTHPIGDGGPPNLVVTQANHLTVFAIRRERNSDAMSDLELGAKAVALWLQLIIVWLGPYLEENSQTLYLK